ncbi:MAG: discoidin domain-containing protein [Solirubrobacteraceae bacterium]
MNRSPRGRWWIAAAVLLSCVLALTAGAFAPDRAGRLGDALADSPAPPGTSLDMALTGTATGSSAATGDPASNAIDGSASTNWCSTEWTGSVTVDLGRVRSLDGFGLTLGSAATTALVNLSYGTTADALHPIADAQQQSVPAGEPVYWPAGHRTLRARFVKVEVTDNDGTPPCIGELRLFERMPQNTIPDRGADLSFQQQEQAAGASFTDNGVPGSPLAILDHHGANYVRLRLWSIRRQATATWRATCEWLARSRPPATSCTWTSTTRTSGRTPSTRTSRPPGRVRT